MESKYKIAVFYEKENVEAVKKLCSVMQDGDLEVFLTDDTMADDMSKEQFSQYVKDVYAFVFLLTPKSLERTALEEEIDFAIQNERIIIPVMLEDFELNGAVAHQLSNVQRVSAYEFNTSDALTIVANQLKNRVEAEKTASYSIFKFFAKKLLFELTKLGKIISKKVKEHVPSTPKVRLVLNSVCLLTIVAVSVYLYWGLSSSYGWTTSEIHLMSFVPILPGFLLMQLSKLIFGKVKNAVLIAVVALITAIATFCVMMLTGFEISVYLQR